MLDHGADVNNVIKDGDFVGYSALTFAAQRGQDFYIKKLTEKGAIVNTHTIFGYCGTNPEKLSKLTNVKCKPKVN